MINIGLVKGGRCELYLGIDQRTAVNCLLLFIPSGLDFIEPTELDFPLPALSYHTAKLIVPSI